MKKILFATAPFDGHFNPLTGLAVYLKESGHDVRWYAGPGYATKLQKLGIPQYKFQRAREINQENLNEVFPERLKIKGTLARLKFDIKHVFMSNLEPMHQDIKDIFEKEFEFDIFICDVAVLAAQLIQETLNRPVFAVGVLPLVENSKDIGPVGMGVLPPSNVFGRMKAGAIQLMLNQLVFKESTEMYHEIMTRHGLDIVKRSIFDAVVKGVKLFVQSGVPGFEYKRSDLSPNIRFAGPLLPHKKKVSIEYAHAHKLDKYEKVILISQGTVDNKEPEKLMIPALEALKNENYLLIVATGYSHTERLKKAYPQENILIEDFIDFDYILKYVDLFITNGGYGSVTLSLSHGVPVLCAGVFEGKNEINARVEYTQCGINMRMEKPPVYKIKKQVAKMFATDLYKQNAEKLRTEFLQYQPYEIIESLILEECGHSGARQVNTTKPLEVEAVA